MSAQRRVIRHIRQFDAHIQEASQKFGISVEKIRAIIATESRGKPEASSGNAFGLMQLTPSTWEDTRRRINELGPYSFTEQNWKDPRLNILFGTATFKIKLQAVKVEPNDPRAAEIAIVAYNAGQGTVRRALENARAGGSTNPTANFLKPQYMKPAIRDAGIHKYYLEGRGKRKNPYINGQLEYHAQRALNAAVDLKYKEVSIYPERIRLYLAVQQTSGRFQPVVTAPVPVPVIDKQGFIQRQGSEFIFLGSPLRFVGANIRGLIHYGHGAPLHFSRHEHIDIQLQAAKDMGARVVRVFGANRHASVKQIGDRLEAALKRVEAHDMYLIFAFTDVHHDTAFNVPGDEHFYQGNYLNKAWYDGGYQQNYLPFVEQIVTRFKEHKRIFAWELGNELKARDGNNVLPELFIQFARHVSDRIRELDPIHLITTGVINSENLGCNNEQAERLYRLPNLDFMTAHVYYSQSLNRWLTIEARRAVREAQRAKRLKMPFIIEEIGFEGGDRAEQTEQHLKKWLESKIASGFMQWGLMGTNQDMGDGDGRFGIHRNQPDFKKIVKRFKQRAQAL